MARFEVNSSEIVERSKELLLAKKKIIANINGTEASAISRFDFQNQSIFSASSELVVAGENFLGHGRSPSPIIAASKAFGENLERYFSLGPEKLGKNNIDFKGVCYNGSVIEFIPALADQVPPESLFNSNGWAFHFTREAALRGALNELVERTILQLAFLSRGWSGFEALQDIEIQSRNITFYQSRIGLFGCRGIIAACDLSNHAGRTFGYGIQRQGDKFKPMAFINAIFEALEPAIFLDENPDFIPSPFDPISVEQVRMAKAPAEDLMRSFEGEEPRSIRSLVANTSILDLSKRLNLDFPLYLAWAVGGNSIPLIIPAVLDERGARYLESKLGKYGVEYQQHEYFPII